MHTFLDERDKELIDGQIGELTNNVSELKGDLKHLESYSTYETTYLAKDQVFKEFYIRNDGTIGVDTANSGFVYECKPNTKYILRRESVNGVFGIGYGIAPVEIGITLNGFKKSSTAKEIEIITDSVSNIIVIYSLEEESVNIGLHEVINKHNIFEIDMLMESGSLPSGKTSYSLKDHLKNKRSAYTIKTNGAKHINFDVKTSDGSAFIMYQYSNSMEYLRYSEFYSSDILIKRGLDIPDDCDYIRFVFENSDIDSAKCYLFYCDIVPQIIKNFKMRDETEWLTFDVTDDVCTCARMLLPPNYSPNEKKSPLILWMDGSGNFTGWESDFASNKLPYLKYLRDEGFAVLSVFGWGNKYLEKYPNCGMAHPYPVPTNLACIKKGIEWVCDRYNIDYDNIHVMSKSQGGQCATYFASKPIVPFKSIGMFAPVVDYLSMPGEDTYVDTRKALAEEMNFENSASYTSTGFNMFSENGKTFARNNKEKLCGMNEAWTYLVGGNLSERIESSLSNGEKFWNQRYWEDESKTDIYTDTDRAKLGTVPVKIWGSSDDDNTPYLAMVEVVKQLQNGGCEAHMRTLPRGTGGHSSAAVGTNLVENITTKLGIEYNNIPVGWVENVEWIRSKMPK